MCRMLLPSWSLIFAICFGAMVPARSLRLGHDPHTQATDIKRGHFLYLVQGEAQPPQWLCDVGARPDAQVIYASFMEELHSTCAGITRTMYLPGSTWTTGRNSLYDESLKLQASQGVRAEYLIFTDGDALLQTNIPNWNPYDLFHAALRNVQPAVATVSMDDQRNTCGPVAPCAPDMDAIVNAFHATAAPMLLPYTAAFDEETWWASQAAMIELLLASMPDYVVQFNHLRVNNSDHSSYPRGFDVIKKPEGGFSKVASYLREHVTGCIKNRIGLVSVSAGTGCHMCKITSQCEDSPDCAPMAGSPVEQVDYKNLVACKGQLWK